MEHAFRALQRVNPPLTKPSEDEEGLKPTEKRPSRNLQTLKIAQKQLQAPLAQRERKASTEDFGLPDNKGAGVPAATPRAGAGSLPRFHSAAGGEGGHFLHLPLFEGWPPQGQAPPPEPHPGAVTGREARGVLSLSPGAKEIKLKPRKGKQTNKK